LEFILSLLVGISLSATSGFRVFVPLLILSIASLAGWVELSPTFSWIGTYPAFAALMLAALLELAAYFIPYVDNLLGAAAVPISILAGMLITASLIIDLHPMLAWTLALVVGGGAALGGSALSNALHIGSTAATGGAANPFLSLAETVGSLFLSVLAVLVPILAFIILALVVYLVVRVYRKMRSQPSIS
jgi:hypothetical protein